jgi:hypothetical protein
MSAVIQQQPLTEADLDAHEDDRFRLFDGSDQPTTGSMPFDASNPDTWPLAQWAARAAYRWRIVLAVVAVLVLTAGAITS